MNGEFIWVSVFRNNLDPTFRQCDVCVKVQKQNWCTTHTKNPDDFRCALITSKIQRFKN